MIRFGQYYSFPAQEVESIDIARSSDIGFPFQLAVHLKSGRALEVNYKTEEARGKDKASLEVRIDNELNGTNRIRDVQVTLDWICNTLRAMEKRQLKVARVIKKLLPPTEGEDL